MVKRYEKYIKKKVEENCEMIWKIWNKIVKRERKYRRKAS
jgi:hypothetical protein